MNLKTSQQIKFLAIFCRAGNREDFDIMNQHPARSFFTIVKKQLSFGNSSDFSQRHWIGTSFVESFLDRIPFSYLAFIQRHFVFCWIGLEVFISSFLGTVPALQKTVSFNNNYLEPTSLLVRSHPHVDMSMLGTPQSYFKQFKFLREPNKRNRFHKNLQHF